MAESTALTTTNQMTISEVMTVGQTMAASGYFQDAKQAAQAVVKILAGREMGFGPFASMTGINIIQGKPAVGSNLMAAAVKNHSKYDYKVDKLDGEICSLVFYEGGKICGTSTFTMGDAQETKYWDAKKKEMLPLAGKFNWRSYPRNMLFARAISNGVRWYCPDVFLGAPVYTPDELGAQTNAEGDILDLAPTVTATPAAGHTNGAVGYEDKPKAFDPLNPDWSLVTSWDHFMDTVAHYVEHYNHAAHVKNALAKIYPDDGAKKGLTYQVAWAALIDHANAPKEEVPA